MAEAFLDAAEYRVQESHRSVRMLSQMFRGTSGFASSVGQRRPASDPKKTPARSHQAFTTWRTQLCLREAFCALRKNRGS
jgi:hypothetical protein